MKAWRDANKMVVDQHELFVDFELERTLQGWIPRRLGGGLGGKKDEREYGGERVWERENKREREREYERARVREREREWE